MKDKCKLIFLFYIICDTIFSEVGEKFMELRILIVFILIFIVYTLGGIVSYIINNKDDFTSNFEEDVKKELNIKDKKKLLTFNKKKYRKSFSLKQMVIYTFSGFALLTIIYLYIIEILTIVTFVWMLIILFGALLMGWLLTQASGGLYQNLVMNDNEIIYVTIKYKKTSNGIVKNVKKVVFNKVYDFTIGKAHINVNGIMDYTISKKDKIKKDEIIFYSIPRVFLEEDKIKEKLREMKKNH